jgi:urease accessory protein UreF
VEQHAVVLGLVARAAGLSPSEAASLALHSLLMGAAAAVVRLLPVDMADAAAVVGHLAPLVDALAQEAESATLSTRTSPMSKNASPNPDKPLLGATLERFSERFSERCSERCSETFPDTLSLRLGDGPAWSAPACELRAEEHARWEVRLFAS